MHWSVCFEDDLVIMHGMCQPRRSSDVVEFMPENLGKYQLVRRKMLCLMKMCKNPDGLLNYWHVAFFSCGCVYSRFGSKLSKHDLVIATFQRTLPKAEWPEISSRAFKSGRTWMVFLVIRGWKCGYARYTWHWIVWSIRTLHLKVLTRRLGLGLSYQ